MTEQTYKDIDRAFKALEEHNDVLDKIMCEIEEQEIWLLQAGYNHYNVDIALDAIKAAVTKGRYDDE